MLTSETIKAIGPAILAVQGAVGTVTKDAKVDAGSRKYRYATLGAVIDAVRDPCVKAGVILLQSPVLDLERGVVSVETRLVHAASGEWISVVSESRISAVDPQAIGSAQTYMRRYGLMAILGLAPDDDDDGQAARGAPTGQPAAPAVPSKPPRDWLKESATMRNRAQLLSLYNEAKGAGAQKAILDALAAKGKALAEAEKAPPAPVDEGPHPFFDAEAK